MKVAICIITFRRPQGLQTLLEALNQQSFREEIPDLQIVVVENEQDGPGGQVCEALRPKLRFPLHYEVEPRRGIPFARNTSLQTAGEDVDFIAMIDDDETPAACWLDELLTVQRRYAADVVAGPVLPVYEEGTPEWVIQGAFHRRRRGPTGEAYTPMGTGNVLFRRAILAEMSPPFDTRFAMTGGSDAHFFQRVVQAGFKAVWADEAIVRETVPETRTTVKWICARAFRAGANFSKTTIELESRLRALRRVGVRAAMHLGWGLFGLPLALFRGWAGLVKQLEHIVRGTGILAGLMGYQHEEYREVHGG